jgi:uncharacterized membrane protein YhaH (DUF805 family)
MSFGDAITTCLRKYAVFSGRAGRPEYWWFVLFNVIVSFVTSILDSALGLDYGAGTSSNGVLSTIATLLLLVPNLAVGSRRLHDSGRSAWWLLIALVPCVGFIVLIIFFCQASQGPNQHGPGPEAPARRA